jgi:hypothetical protein
MPDQSDAIDRLYQSPLPEFTAARNEAAKAAGTEGAAIRALQKPSVPAWAVNQLYWRERRAWDALVRAAQDLRAAHRRQIAGRRADVDAAERAHREAVREAADRIRNLLREAGDVASASTMAAIIETLHALPSTEPPGRLTKPLKPAGLEALAGLVPGGGASAFLRLAQPPQTAQREEPRSARGDKEAERRAAQAAKKEAAARKKAAERLTKQIRAAKSAERDLHSTVGKARQAFQRAEREQQQLRDKLQFVGKQVSDLETRLREAERRTAEAAAEREGLEAQLATLN